MHAAAAAWLRHRRHTSVQRFTSTSPKWNTQRDTNADENTLIRPTGAPHQGDADNKHRGENQKSESQMKTKRNGGKLGGKKRRKQMKNKENRRCSVSCGASVPSLMSCQSGLAQSEGWEAPVHPAIPPSLPVRCSVSAPAPNWGPVCH